MTTLALSLFLLACGWKLYKDWRLSRYSALSNQGHPQYFAAALIAGYLFCLSAALHNAFSQISPYADAVDDVAAIVPTFVGKDEKLSALVWLAVIVVWSAVLTPLLAWAFNLPLFRSPALLVAVAKKAGSIDQFEGLLHQCLSNDLLVAVTLKSTKVYIGSPERSGPHDHERTWVGIWPMASGYRDKFGKLNINTPYLTQYKAIQDGNKGLQLDDFRVVLPRSEISSIQLFDLAAYESFRVEPSLPADVASAPSPNQAPDLDGYRQKLTREIISEHEAYRYRFYWIYISLVTASIMAAPLSLLVSVLALGLSAVAYQEAVDSATAPN